MTRKPDILIFMSDQHSYQETEFSGSSPVRTPFLSEIGKEGCVFDSAYTSCPLCVPARSSFMTTKLPSRTGIFTNNDSIPEDMPTFVHSLALAGYETVLCGRMHFMGSDQRHGFSKRIADDITCLYWGLNRQMADDMGVFAGKFGENGCLGLAAGGDSPIEEYDSYVTEKALGYLSEDHEKPQCIVVGTYAPHFPYVGDRELYDHYMALPEDAPTPAFDYAPTDYKRQECSPELLRRVRASYRAMCEMQDRHIGKVHEAWKSYLGRTGRRGIFVYTSDHGDMLGDRELFAKKSLFERSAHIPMVFEGDGIVKGARISSPVSLMDIGTTFIDIAEGPALPDTDGVSLRHELETGENSEGRSAVSENADDHDGTVYLGRMVRYGRWKHITYHGEGPDLLYDIENDPAELSPIEAKNSKDVQFPTNLLYTYELRETLEKEYMQRKRSHALFIRWARSVCPDMDMERWRPSTDTVKGKDLVF